MEDLLNREADPDGERYALAKVLHTCQVGSKGFVCWVVWCRCVGIPCVLGGWLERESDMAASNKQAERQHA